MFSHDFTAILLSQNNETAAMLVSQTSPMGVELFFMPTLSFVPINLYTGRVGENALYATSTFPTMHLILHDLCLSFLLGYSRPKRNSKRCIYKIWGGANKVIMGNVEVAYGRIALAVATIVDKSPGRGGGGGLVWFGGGSSQKNRLKRGGHPKKNRGKGGSREIF